MSQSTLSPCTPETVTLGTNTEKTMMHDRESRRTLAQFLNALAVTLLGTLVLAPLAAGAFETPVAAAAIAAAICLHVAALGVARGR